MRIILVPLLLVSLKCPSQAQQLPEVGDSIQATQHFLWCYKDLTEHKKALYYANEYIQWQASLLSFNIFSKINELETTYVLEKEKETRKQVEREQKLQGEIMHVQTGGIQYPVLSTVLLSVILLVLTTRFRQKLKLSSELAVKNMLITTQNAQIETTNLNLQLRLIRAQIDPHFVFNIMNTIQHLILTKDKEYAVLHVSKLAKLMRFVLEKSSTTMISVQEEISMLELYIQLEQVRLDYKFDHLILKEFNEDVLVPTMLLQPYVENAILHGLCPLENRRGRLTIVFKKIDNRLLITIEDNGVGTHVKRETATHQSMGSKLGQQRLDLLTRVQKDTFTVVLMNCRNHDGTSSGTRVIVDIPLYVINKTTNEKTHCTYTG